MKLVPLDWIIIAGYGLVALAIGVWMSRRAGKDVESYFVAGRSLPWWLAGTSIAATWFASDAPLAAVSMIRKHGIYANWLWWYLGAGTMLMVFFYAKLWRRSHILTDAEFIELRYSGKPASVLRVFKACYEGLLRNCFRAFFREEVALQFRDEHGYSIVLEDPDGLPGQGYPFSEGGPCKPSREFFFISLRNINS